MRRKRFLAPMEEESRDAVLLRRARRHKLRGEARQAMLAVREACFRAATDARLWALYGDACRRARRRDEAKDALRQAIWLRERERDGRRAASLQRLLSTMDSGPDCAAA